MIGPGTGQPQVSAVVPTRDRRQSLERCLAALAAQEGIALEIVVVDDRSAGADAIEALVEATPAARLVRGEGRGPAAARNLGAREATAPLVLYTDDDCEPEPGWAAALERHSAAGAAVVAGRTVNAAPGDRLAEASQHIANFLGEHSRLEGPPFAASNNVAVRAGVMARFPFDERYPAAAGEDRDWCARIGEATYGIAREPAAVVRHRQDLDLRRFWRQHFRYGRGARQFGRDHAEGAMPSSRRLYLGIVRSAFGHGVVVGLLVCVAQVATALGYAAETLQPAAARHRSDPNYP